jgi:hypothetical protein
MSPVFLEPEVMLLLCAEGVLLDAGAEARDISVSDAKSC